MRPLYPAARCSARALRRPLNRRRYSSPHGSRSLAARQEVPHTVNVPVLPQPEAFDPDMLYVECGHCGAPIVWKRAHPPPAGGRGIDPLELDASCVLITGLLLVRRTLHHPDLPHQRKTLQRPLMVLRGYA